MGEEFGRPDSEGGRQGATIIAHFPGQSDEGILPFAPFSEHLGGLLGFLPGPITERVPEIKVEIQVPVFVKGVINLRGKVIPVIDLRLKFGLEEIDYTERTCIIVVEIASETGTLPTGVIVDSVSEVIAIKDEDIEDTPEFGTTLDTAFISGMAKKDSDIKILLDIDSVVSTTEIDTLASAA